MRHETLAAQSHEACHSLPKSLPASTQWDTRRLFGSLRTICVFAERCIVWLQRAGHIADMGLCPRIVSIASASVSTAVSLHTARVTPSTTVAASFNPRGTLSRCH